MPGYRKREQIGYGGQAKIYRGEDVDTGDSVALKYLTLSGTKRPLPSEAEEERVRFLREVQEQSTLEHPNIVPVLGYSGRQQRPWYAMPLAEGSLEACLKGPKQEVAWCLDVVHKVIDGMTFAHEQGVIHRDLKPSNILRIDGDWKVSDFGFCRNLNSDSLTITKPGQLVGTVLYAAPEQFDDAHDVGPTADIYAVGRILIHCLAWNTPGLAAHRLDEIPQEFRETVIRCVAEHPNQRFQSFPELRESLVAAYGQFREEG